jgi:hypothetical protein
MISPLKSNYSFQRFKTVMLHRMVFVWIKTIYGHLQPLDFYKILPEVVTLICVLTLMVETAHNFLLRLKLKTIIYQQTSFFIYLLSETNSDEFPYIFISLR